MPSARILIACSLFGSKRVAMISSFAPLSSFRKLSANPIFLLFVGYTYTICKSRAGLRMGEHHTFAHDVLQLGNFQPFQVRTPAHFRASPRTDIQHPAVQHIIHSAKGVGVHTPATITQFVLVLDHADLLFGIGGQDVEDDTDEFFLGCSCHSNFVFLLYCKMCAKPAWSCVKSRSPRILSTL